MTETLDDIIGKVDEPAPRAAPVSAPGGRPCIVVDYERYAHFLDDTDLSEDDKRQFAQAIWSLIFDFVSLGFGVHPLQQARNGQDKSAKSLPSDLSDLISWHYPSQEQEPAIASPHTGGRKKEDS